MPSTLDEISKGINREDRKLWIMLVLFATPIAFGLGCFLVFAYDPSFSRLKLARTTIAGWRGPIGAQGAPKDTAAPIHELGFSDAMNRLDSAFQRHPGVSAEQIILQVNASVPTGTAQPCPFLWQSDGMALVIHKNQQGRLALAGTVNSCAESIERLP